MKQKPQYLVLLCSAGIVLLDQFFKVLVSRFLLPIPGRTVSLIPGVLHLSYVENRGAAFGILDGSGVFLSILTGIIIVVAVVILLLEKTKSKVCMWSLGLIIGGGVGNLIDRLFRHYVIDYIDVRLFHFAVFNLADCCVVVGTILLLIYFLFFDRSENGGEQKNG